MTDSFIPFVRRCGEAILLVALWEGVAYGQDSEAQAWEQYMRPITPKGYVCYRAASPPALDGRLDDPAWQAVSWTDAFVDIEGARQPAPRFATRVKMLWDDGFFYVGAYLEEPHVWGTLTEKNAIIYHDNDFEIFIDPDGDHHAYYEFEVNALNTIWELTLAKPYTAGGPALHGTNIEGLQSAVHVAGTLNNPRDTDTAWTVEVAIPWNGLALYSPAPLPPQDGTQWRVNFSRVEWQHTVVDGAYQKVPNQPEANWAWSPQGVIDMHRPERWGYVQFSTASSGTVRFRPDPTRAARDHLMTVYYRQRQFRADQGRWARSLEALGLAEEEQAEGVRLIGLNAQNDRYVATVRMRLPDGTARELHVNHEARIWTE